ncbi:MAG: aldehyde dehydrogenase family protein [Planctomycetes bacterium]|nr:aldehyde dehydrogenase family protein [Planctomycetota bacterium]NBY03718.1 aldehyde dehydrogenase family protein [Planctomycetota bacterium]
MKPIDDEPSQETIIKIGKVIFDRMQKNQAIPFGMDWFEDRLMEFSTHNDDVKINLFRFIDSFPSLTTPKEITDHLKAYLGQSDSGIPWWMSFLIKLLPSRGLAGKLLEVGAKFAAGRMAKKFIAGSNFNEVEKSLTRLRKSGLGYTIDILGEATITNKEADYSLEEYKKLALELSEKSKAKTVSCDLDFCYGTVLPKENISIKVSALDSQLDSICPEKSFQRLRPKIASLLRFAMKNNLFIYFDMEQTSLKEIILHTFKSLLAEPEFKNWPNVGIAIQAYLKQSHSDLIELREWAAKRGTPVWIRLVKGAYWDYETVTANLNGWDQPVWQTKAQTDLNYEFLTSFLLSNNNHLRPAFGSHNARSVAYAIAKAQILKVPDSNLEFQVLYGMGDAMGNALAKLGYRVRVYTPFGELIPGMAYFVRRLLENTANDSFLKASMLNSQDEDFLLMKPATTQPPAAPIAITSNHTFHNEPLTDFTIAKNRLEMAKLIKMLTSLPTKTYLPIINGKEIHTQSFIESINPSHKHHIVGKIGCASITDTNLAIISASKAFNSWNEVKTCVRANQLRKAAQKLRERKLEMASWQVIECGKSWREADADVSEAIDFCEYYASLAEIMAIPKTIQLAGETNQIFYQPRGVAVVISPWNFPLAILAGMSAAALATGNTLIMKPAEQSSVVAYQWMKILLESGFPESVVQFLPGIGEEIGPHLVSNPLTSIIAFTGSRKVGLEINQLASKTDPSAKFVKKIIAEMGGKNCIIIDKDADMDEALTGVVSSAIDFQGQKCSACSRVLIPREMHDAFGKRLSEAVASKTLGPAEDPANQIGPVIDEDSRVRIEKRIEDSKKSAKLIYRADVGNLINEGFFVGPAIFADADPKSDLCQQEIFGPVIALIPYDSLHQAISIANDTPYALTAGVYSRNPESISLISRYIEAGNLYINRKITGAMVHRQPFGGYRLSGLGSKAGGTDYLLQFVLPRTITENTLRRGFAPGVPTRGFDLEIP